MHLPPRTSAVVVATLCAAASVTLGARPGPDEADARPDVLARAQVWRPTNVPAMDLKAGPPGPGAFPLGSTVVCSYRDKAMGGRSPKFACAIGKHDEVKVKFGGANGEVYGEVLATRLLWALGFGADRMYPVKVECRGCPDDLGGTQLANGNMRFDPAVIERKMTGTEWPPHSEGGWSWKEVDEVKSAAGGASKAQRDGLKLIAVFLDHTDSKPAQQRIVCLPSGRPSSHDSCRQPFLILQDVGLTFGGPSRSNANAASGVNLAAWRKTPVWKDTTGCTGNMPKSFTGSLEDPAISEEGRQFVARLLGQLTDRQLRDLFETARVPLRLREPSDVSSGFATIDEWIAAFKDRRTQIAERHCAS